MLSSMFSGQFQVTKDDTGRYFIDADGNLFSHILRYLRCGQLPPNHVAEDVYNEAKYFGLEELAQHMERMPVLMAKQARLQFQSQLSGFDDAIEKIIKTASTKQCIMADEVVSFAVIAIHRENKYVENENFDNNHRCFASLPLEKCSADVVIGPWDNKLEDVTEKVYLRAVTRELESRSFTVTVSNQGFCSYGITNPDRVGCVRAIFKVVFHWHRFG